MASRDLPWAFHNVYPSFDVQNVPGYPNHCPTEWRASCPKFDGDPALAVTHVVNYMKYASSLNVLHEDVLMKIFVSSLESSQKDWLAHSCDPKSIPSSTKLIEEFLRQYRPSTQSLQDAFQELKNTLCREGFPIDDETIDEEKLEEDPDEEDMDETYNEDEVSAPPLDKDIHTSVPPALQEENMMSYNPFENFDDALFHDCGNEENCQRDLNEVSFAEGPNETLLSAFPSEENEVTQSCEEVISSYGADEFVEQPSDIVDEHIDDFIQTGRRKWDLSCLKFDRDPIYDIEGGSQAEGVSSYVYDSDVWQPGDDMVTDLFSPFEDNLSHHTQSGFHSSLDAHPFEDVDLFYKDFQPLCLDFDRYEVVASPRQSSFHSTKRKFCHLGDSHKDS
jgi:hypothetical protein